MRRGIGFELSQRTTLHWSGLCSARSTDSRGTGTVRLVPSRITMLRPRSVTAGLLIGRRREAFLGFYGPLSLLGLLGLWAVGILTAFGILQWSAGSALAVVGGVSGFGSDLYLSGTTFFTLGLGDVVPRTTLA